MTVDSTALLAHILSQTRQNVEFLVAQNQISPDNGRDILLKLPASPSTQSDTSSSSITSLTQKTQKLAVSTPTSNAPNINQVSSAIHSAQQVHSPPPATGPPVLFRVKAIWNYNERGQDPTDLSFYAGEIIDIIAETNADWWTGRHKGKEALFPSNYVERIPASAVPSLPAPVPYPGNKQGHAGYSYPGYQPPGYQGPPPPAHAVYAHYDPPGGGPPPSALNPAPDAQNPPKKGGMFSGGLGNTLKHSAVGGVGFGAGSAVGSGIINSIF